MNESDLDETEREQLEEHASTLSKAAEALMVIRNLRARKEGKGRRGRPGRIDSKSGKGRGSPSSGPSEHPPISPPLRGRGRGRGASRTNGRNGQGRGQSSRGASFPNRKKPDKRNSECKACGQKGHWAGDPECPMGPQSGFRPSRASRPPREVNTIDLESIGESEVCLTSVILSCLATSSSDQLGVLEHPDKGDWPLRHLLRTDRYGQVLVRFVREIARSCKLGDPNLRAR